MAEAALKTRTVEQTIRASIHEMEPAIQTRLGTVWQVRTADPLEAVMAAGYFDPCASHGLRVNDKIEVTSVATTPASFATLAITEIRHAEPGEPRVLTRTIFQSKGK